jgi:hypothetical protein
MKKLGIIILFLGMAGCAQESVVGFNTEARTVSIRVNKFATEGDARAKAQSLCNGPAKLISMGMQATGAYAQDLGDGDYIARTREAPVYTFQCAPKQQAPRISQEP